MEPRALRRSVDLGTGKGQSIRSVVELLIVLTESRVRPQFGTVSDRLTNGCHVPDLEGT